MKISPVQLRAIQTYNQTLPVKRTSGRGVSFKDRLEISTQAKEMQVVSSYQTERNEKIDSLKKQISEGTYKVDSEQVARDMLKYFRR